MGPPGPAARPRRRRRILAGIALTIVGLPLLYLVVTFVQVVQAGNRDDARPADAIVVLGAAQYNGRPSPALEARLSHALALYRTGLADRIWVTGGRQEGDRYTEATTGYNWLRARGVPDAAIRKEVQGRTTWESLREVAHFEQRDGGGDVILVSGPAHALRLRGIADDLGLDAVVSPSPGEPSLRTYARESVGVAIGRIIGYRRLERFDT